MPAQNGYEALKRKTARTVSFTTPYILCQQIEYTHFDKLEFLSRSLSLAGARERLRTLFLTQKGSPVWSLGVLVGGPIAIVFIVASVIWTRYASKQYEHNKGYYDEGLWRTCMWTGIGVLVATLVITAWGYFPYKMEYHHWTTVQGTVTQVGNRILGSSSSLQQKYVVVVNGQEYGCEDTRCALIKKGDTIELSCKRVWQYAGVDGYDCSFVSRTPAKK